MQRGAGLLGVRKLVSSMAGAKLCYGEPVRAGERVVIPVARIQAGGGGGWGGGRGEDGSGGDGGGGGGGLEAAPVGFIDIGPEGARFEAIPDPDRAAKLVRAGAMAAATVLVATAVHHRLTSGAGRRLSAWRR